MAKVSRHEISMSGTSGSIFWFLMGATVVCAIGLATPAWWVNNRQTEGLWQKCNCDTHNKDDGKSPVLHSRRGEYNINVSCTKWLLQRICSLCQYADHVNKHMLYCIFFFMYFMCFFYVFFVLYCTIPQNTIRWSPIIYLRETVN